jgi:hypothetical protein
VTGLRAPEFRLINLLQSEEATLPKSFAESEDYRTRLESALAVYQAKLQSLTAPDEMSDAVRKAIPAMAELSAALLNALDAILKGNGRTAHDLFRSAMSNAVIKGAVETLSSQELARKQIKTLYRMRSVTALESLPRGAMFHIPFHSRWRVATQRYSAPGVPMLYCGSSLGICWEELKRPNLDSTWSVGLKIRDAQSVRILNLAYRPSQVAGFAQGTSAKKGSLAALAVAYATLWPLLAACSCVVPVRTEPVAFVVEYVVPQLLLSWLIEEGEYDGIRYFSTKLSGRPYQLLGVNFVFPAKEIASTGYCARLSKIFEMSPPISWQLAKVVPAPPATNPAPNGPPGGASGIFPYATGLTAEYTKTEFFKLEERIENTSFDAIK